MMIRRTLFSVLALVLLCSCMKLERQQVDKRFYSLDVARPVDAAGVGSPARNPGALLVRRLQVSPRCSGRELVYHLGESSWTADYYNLFFLAPADMLSQDLRTWLGAASLYGNVVDPASLLEPNFVLEGNVTALHGDFSVKPAQAVVEMQFLLLRNDGSERRVLMTKELRQTVPLAGGAPQDVVRALRQAVAVTFAELEAALRQVSAK